MFSCGTLKRETRADEKLNGVNGNFHGEQNGGGGTKGKRGTEGANPSPALFLKFDFEVLVRNFMQPRERFCVIVLSLINK